MNTEFNNHGIDALLPLEIAQKAAAVGMQPPSPRQGR